MGLGSNIVSPTHLLFVVLIVVLLFGTKRLPEFGRSVGQGMREFKDSISGKTSAEADAAVPPELTATAQPHITTTSYRPDQPEPALFAAGTTAEQRSDA
jgi:sec-independent protein translocase protein TatA